MDNIIQNNGFTIAVSGWLVVFIGLILISLVIHGFNLFFRRWFSRQQEKSLALRPLTEEVTRAAQEIPPDHLVAIVSAIEIYRRLHFDDLQSEITFASGDAQTSWKLGHRYGQRFFSAYSR
ncbi:OadG family protein [candidate division KSB1 bacterium]|nr:OadG family protein [candidate division KSB1 bacterium]